MHCTSASNLKVLDFYSAVEMSSLLYYTNDLGSVNPHFVFQVSLGKTNDLLAANYQAHKLPAGCHSVRGMGAVAPNPSGVVTL